MGGWPAAPVVFEIDTWPWLQELSGGDAPTSLAAVSPAEWDAVLPDGVDAVWLMGVWERSPAGLSIARGDAALRGSFTAALPDVRAEDLVGSPYCVRRYRVDERLGGPSGLAVARDHLARRGVRLLLDYVPNHVAPDHPWVTERPELFVRGTYDDLAAEPASWLEVDGTVLAHGRDPNFPPWPDVVQVNAFAARLRDATIETLVEIGDQCDGVRCDMAMLMTNEVFRRTWGERCGPGPAEEFWPLVVGQVRRRRPGMLFVAEAYWDMEWDLQQQGFDFCYDKRLYDRLVGRNAGAVREHLRASPDYQDRLVRFIENHDEPRAAAVFDPEEHRAAAVVTATVPGATLWHDGQLTGRRTHLPVFLGRRPQEPSDGDLRAFYESLLSVAGPLREGTWTLLECSGWPDNDRFRNLLAWAWQSPAQPPRLVVVNFSAVRSQGVVPIPWPDAAGRGWTLTDLLEGDVFQRQGDELAGQGLYVDLAPWGCHVLQARPVGAGELTPAG